MVLERHSEGPREHSRRLSVEYPSHSANGYNRRESGLTRRNNLERTGGHMKVKIKVFGAGSLEVEGYPPKEFYVVIKNALLSMPNISWREIKRGPRPKTKEEPKSV